LKRREKKRTKFNTVGETTKVLSIKKKTSHYFQKKKRKERKSRRKSRTSTLSLGKGNQPSKGKSPGGEKKKGGTKQRKETKLTPDPALNKNLCRKKESLIS